METEQLNSRLEWLDEERRKDRAALTTLEERLKGLEKEIAHLRAQLKTAAGRPEALASPTERFMQLEQTLAQQRVESGRQITDLEKRLEALSTAQTAQHVALEETRKAIGQLRKTLNLRPIQHDLQARATEAEHLRKELVEVKNQMETLARTQEDLLRAQKALEEGRRQDEKALTELRGDVLATRKRIDAAREAINRNADDLRRLETRLSELLAGEAERKQAQTEFLENQARLQVERERIWKEWEQHFETLARQSEELETQLRAWEIAQRSLKRAQETYEELIQKLERRINEIVEMQRLAEDRTRQEWTAFRAEEQKRWANYTVTQEETIGDLRNEIARLESRLAAVEDLAQTQQDILIQTKEANEQLLHTLLAQIHDLLAAYDRIVGVIQSGR